MIARPCPVCLDTGTRQVVVLGVGYVFNPCELCIKTRAAARWKKAARTFRVEARHATRDYVELSEELISEHNENARLKAEILEARNEAAAVRRAYLHEKNRAEDAIQRLRAYEPGPASVLERRAYTGPGERMCMGKALGARCFCPEDGPLTWNDLCQYCKGYP